MLDEVKIFFERIDPIIAQIFNSLLNNEMIVETDMDDLCGTCHKIDSEIDGIILKHNIVPIHKIFTIFHEGHAYFYYLDSIYPTLFRSHISNEVMSRIFEQLFLLYLREKKIIKENDLDIYERFFHVQQLYATNKAYIINSLLMNNIIEPQFKPEDIQLDLSNPDILDLGILKERKKVETTCSFTANYYGYAYMLSCLFRERYLKNPHESLQELKELSTCKRELTSLEFIHLFDNQEYINATNKNITRILSKTRYK